MRDTFFDGVFLKENPAGAICFGSTASANDGRTGEHLSTRTKDGHGFGGTGAKQTVRPIGLHWISNSNGQRWCQ